MEDDTKPDLLKPPTFSLSWLEVHALALKRPPGKIARYLEVQRPEEVFWLFPSERDPDHCRNCNLPRLHEKKGAQSVCPGCGDVVNTSLSSHALGTDARRFSYRRSAHFLEIIRRSQGREATRLKREVMAQIRAYLTANHICIEALDAQSLRAILKRMNLSSQYVHLNLILADLREEELPRLSLQQESQLLNLFAIFEKAWNDNASTTGRTNLLSYGLLARMLCVLAGYKAHAETFPLLKSRSKLLQQIRIYNQIADSVGWPRADSTIF